MLRVPVLPIKLLVFAALQQQRMVIDFHRQLPLGELPARAARRMNRSAADNIAMNCMNARIGGAVQSCVPVDQNLAITPIPSIL